VLRDSNLATTGGYGTSLLVRSVPLLNRPRFALQGDEPPRWQLSSPEPGDGRCAHLPVVPQGRESDRSQCDDERCHDTLATQRLLDASPNPACTNRVQPETQLTEVIRYTRGSACRCTRSLAFGVRSAWAAGAGLADACPVRDRPVPRAPSVPGAVGASHSPAA